jgi:hypothetical protein
MGSEELQELKEHAEKAKEDKSLAPVSLTMAVLAVLVALVSVAGHRAHTEEVVLQAKSSDQWAFFQAKSIRRHNDEIFADLASVVTSSDATTLAKLRGKYSDEAKGYRDQQNEIEAEAKKLEEEVAMEGRRADRYDLSEVFLEIGLVVTSITLLSGRKAFWRLGMVLGTIGLIVAGTGLLIH